MYQKSGGGVLLQAKPWGEGGFRHDKGFDYTMHIPQHMPRAEPLGRRPLDHSHRAEQGRGGCVQGRRRVSYR